MVPISSSSERLSDVNHIESIVRHNRDDGDSDDEFFDCKEVPEDLRSLTKWNSMELVPDNETEYTDTMTGPELRRAVSYQSQSRTKHNRPTIELAEVAEVACPTSIFILVVHGGSILDGHTEPAVRKSDVTTLRGAFESIMRQHYQGLVGRLVMKCVACPNICDEALSVLSSLSPYSTNSSLHANDRLPLSCIPVLAASSPQYQHHVNTLIAAANKEYQDFLESEDGYGFCGQVCILADSVGSLLAYDALCREPMTRTDTSEGEDDDHGDSLSPLPSGHGTKNSHLSVKNDIRTSNFHFDVSHFFLLGSPLPIVLAYRQNLASDSNGRAHARPNCAQVYNMFHASNPVVARLEPLLLPNSQQIGPVNIPRYGMFPVGDGSRITLAEMIQTHAAIFNSRASKSPVRGRRLSNESVQSGLFETQQAHMLSDIKRKWWGNKRLGKRG